MERIHLYANPSKEYPLRIDRELIDGEGGISESENCDNFRQSKVSRAIDYAWNQARERGLPLMISADVVNLEQ